MALLADTPMGNDSAYESRRLRICRQLHSKRTLSVMQLTTAPQQLCLSLCLSADYVSPNRPLTA